MSENKEKIEDELNWVEGKLKNPNENIVPLLKATILLLKEEKKRTEEKIKELKKLRDLNKNG